MQTLELHPMKQPIEIRILHVMAKQFLLAKCLRVSHLKIKRDSPLHHNQCFFSSPHLRFKDSMTSDKNKIDMEEEVPFTYFSLLRSLV